MMSIGRFPGLRPYACVLRLPTVLLLGVLLAGAATSSRCEVNVEGTVAAVNLTAGKDTIADALSALAAAFPVSWRTAIPLDKTVSGSYSGSLRQVISRLLDGNNFLIKQDQDRLEIVVFGRQGERPLAAPPPPAPAIKNIAAQWR